MIAKNLIILVALAVVAFVGAFSWFTQNTTAIADGIYARTEVNDKLEFYIMPPSDDNQYSAINTRLSENAAWNAQHKNDDGFVARRTKWHEGGLDFDFTDQEFKFMNGLFMTEVTGDGTSFYIPKLLQYNQIAYVDKTQEFETAVANDNYMSFDLYFRSQSKYSVVLTHDSKIEPVDKNNILGQNAYNLANSDASTEEAIKPAAIGAVRFSVLNCEANNEQEVLWIPGPNVWYDAEHNTLYTGLSSTGTGNHSFSGKGSAIWDDENVNGGLKQTTEGTTSHAYFNSSRMRVTIPNGTGNVRASTEGNYLLGANSSDDVEVVTLNNEDLAGGYWYGHIRVNLWIEGEDSEARLKLVNGKFNMSLCFDIIESVESGS